MTPREKQCLDAIATLTVDGVAPTMQDIADHMGLKSKSGVHRLIESLDAQGKIDRGPKLWRYRSPRKVSIAGSFDDSALSRMSHADLVALRGAIDRRLSA